MNQKNIEREIFPQIANHLKQPEITLIIGARQVGKTVLLGMVKNYLIQKKKINPDNILYFNLDIVKDWEFFQNQTVLIEFLKEKALNLKGKIYLIVDEAQRVPECGRFFKGIYDSNLGVKMLLSGSAVLELRTRSKESLTGRKKIFNVSSFSFLEFLKTKDKSLAKALEKEEKISLLSKNRLNSFFQEYAVWGGYPRVVLSKTKAEKQSILAELYSSYIEKDIVGLLDIKNKLGFSKLVKLLAGQTGQLVNIGELSSSLNLDRGTVERYIKALEDTFILTPIYPYFRNSRQEIIKQNKIYFNDSGLRNYALQDFSSIKKRQDGGLLLENAIFREISPHLDPLESIRFWRTRQGSEVDFLILKEEKIVPIEVKMGVKKSTVSLSFRNFIKKYSPETAIVVNLLLEDKIKIEKTTVNFIYPFNVKKALE